MSSRLTLRTAGQLTCAVALAIAFSNPAAAQIQKPKNATKNLKFQSQQIINEAKKQLINPKVVLGARLKGFTKAVANGAPYDAQELQELYEDIDEVQAEVSDAIQTAVMDMRDAASLLLADINGASVDPAAGIFPENFYRGDQGHLDLFHYNVREIARKSMKLARKRMRKLAKNIRKNTSINLTSVVGPRLAMPALVIGEGTVDPIEELLMVDLLMAHSDGNFPDDGVIHASGSGNPGEGDVTVEVYDITGALVDTQVSQLSTGTAPNRWIVHFSGLTEGNYQVLAKQGEHRSLSEIGIR
jgi:hypothetical protein